MIKFRFLDDWSTECVSDIMMPMANWRIYVITYVITSVYVCDTA